MNLLSLCRWIETAPSIKIILLSSISPEWELGCWGSYLLPSCGGIVPTRAVGHILHSVNSRCQLHLLNTVGDRKIELWVQFVPLCNALRLKRTFFSRQLSLSGKEPLLTGRLWHDSVLLLLPRISTPKRQCCKRSECRDQPASLSLR